MKKNIFTILIAIAVILFCKQSSASQPTPQEIANLRAFTKLYGYVRFFHPSNEASAIDWDKFAMYGAGKVRFVSNDTALKTVLEELFKPLAPTMQLYWKGETPKPLSSLFPKDTAGLHVVAWQHKGVGLQEGNSTV